MVHHDSEVCPRSSMETGEPSDAQKSWLERLEARAKSYDETKKLENVTKRHRNWSNWKRRSHQSDHHNCQSSFHYFQVNYFILLKSFWILFFLFQTKCWKSSGPIFFNISEISNCPPLFAESQFLHFKKSGFASGILEPDEIFVVFLRWSTIRVFFYIFI